MQEQVHLDGVREYTLITAIAGGHRFEVYGCFDCVFQLSVVVTSQLYTFDMIDRMP